MGLMSYKEWQQRTYKAIDQFEFQASDVDGALPIEEFIEDKLQKINEATAEDLCQIKGVGPKIARKIVENGPYTEISEIIRKYIEGRFFIKALEETSREILTELEQQELENTQYQVMHEFFELTDFVKFAKYKPNNDENSNILDWAKKFILDTKIEFEQTELKIEVNEKK